TMSCGACSVRPARSWTGPLRSLPALWSKTASSTPKSAGTPCASTGWAANLAPVAARRSPRSPRTSGSRASAAPASRKCRPEALALLVGGAFGYGPDAGLHDVGGYRAFPPVEDGALAVDDVDD